jgi:hypothetical protein
MQAEATQAKASGIVGVNVAVNNHVWGEHATEFCFPSVRAGFPPDLPEMSRPK